MTKTEFVEVGLEVFEELLPKTRGAARRAFLLALAAELQDFGLDIEDDSSESEDQAEEYE
jgi:hypothetical protein